MPVAILTPSELTSLERELSQAKSFAMAARAASTERLYASDWRHFVDWCRSRGLAALPAAPATVAVYLAAFAGPLRVSTLQRRLAAIGHYHRRNGHVLDVRTSVIADVWQGIRRTLGTVSKGKAPLLTADIRWLCSHLPETLIGLRNRALILLGFAGAFRRSELVALDIDDIAFAGEGLLLTLRRGKADQDGRGLVKAIPRGNVETTCPVRALAIWLDAGGVDRGPVFRPIDRFARVAGCGLAPAAVAKIIKMAVRAAVIAEGGTAAEADRRSRVVAGHSLRSGFAVQASTQGATDAALITHTGHRHIDSLRPYLNARLFNDAPASRLGL